jgi:hypothetical protein
MMKKNKSLYWTITGCISLLLLFSAWYTGTHVVEFKNLGFPNYFRIELTTAKIIGAFVILIPQVSARVKEWIYISFCIVLISAFIAKFMNKYPAAGLIEPMSVFIIMIFSIRYLHQQAITK